MAEDPHIEPAFTAAINRAVERARRVSYAIDDHATLEDANAIFDAFHAVANELQDDPDDDDALQFCAIGLWLGMIARHRPRATDTAGTALPTA